MPEGFARVYADYAAMGWPGLTAPEAFGGQGMSPLIAPSPPRSSPAPTIRSRWSRASSPVPSARFWPSARPNSRRA
jgi:hypothetical protein